MSLDEKLAEAIKCRAALRRYRRCTLHNLFGMRRQQYRLAALWLSSVQHNYNDFKRHVLSEQGVTNMDDGLLVWFEDCEGLVEDHPAALIAKIRQGMTEQQYMELGPAGFILTPGKRAKVVAKAREAKPLDIPEPADPVEDEEESAEARLRTLRLSVAELRTFGRHWHERALAAERRISELTHTVAKLQNELRRLNVRMNKLTEETNRRVEAVIA